MISDLDTYVNEVFGALGSDPTLISIVNTSRISHAAPLAIR